MRNLLVRLCHHRFLPAVALGLGLGWALSASLGAGTGFAVGGALTLAFLPRSGSG